MEQNLGHDALNAHVSKSCEETVPRSLGPAATCVKVLHIAFEAICAGAEFLSVVERCRYGTNNVNEPRLLLSQFLGRFQSFHKGWDVYETKATHGMHTQKV
jgi:hypothetical protein